LIHCRLLLTPEDVQAHPSRTLLYLFVLFMQLPPFR
jgi:hypothetical protein